MGCGTREGNEGVGRAQEEALKEAMEYVTRDEDEVECSVCEIWTCGRVGVDGLTREEVSKMDVYCRRCMDKMCEIKVRNSAYSRKWRT